MLLQWTLRYSDHPIFTMDFYQSPMPPTLLYKALVSMEMLFCFQTVTRSRIVSWRCSQTFKNWRHQRTVLNRCFVTVCCNQVSPIHRVEWCRLSTSCSRRHTGADVEGTLKLTHAGRHGGSLELLSDSASRAEFLVLDLWRPASISHMASLAALGTHYSFFICCWKMCWK